MDTYAQKYASDFIAATDLRESVLRALSDESSKPLQRDSEQPTDLEDVLPDGRKVLLYFPHGRNYMKTILGKPVFGQIRETSPEQSMPSQEPSSLEAVPQRDSLQLYFVLFVGYKKGFSQGQDLTKPSWDLDSGLKKEMVAIKEILSYSSCERTVGGDWTNLVIITSLDVLDKWQASPLHSVAVRDFSPQFYSKIRIHRGQILGDIRNGIFNLHRTLFLNYNTAEAIPKRQEKYWNKCEPSERYDPVLFKCNDISTEDSAHGKP